MSHWLLGLLKGTIFHPQWMTDYFHWQSKQYLDQLVHGFETRKLIIHRNTLVAALQMVNLSLLGICRDTYRYNRTLGLMAGLLVYPATLMINFLAWPLLYLLLGKAGNSGYFLIAKLKNN